MVQNTLHGEDLKRSAREFLKELLSRIKNDQHNNATFFDSWIYTTINTLNKCDESLSWEDCAKSMQGPAGDAIRNDLPRLRHFLERRENGRFVPYEQRYMLGHNEVNPMVLSLAQGTARPMQWKGSPLFKTTYDVSIYNMLMWDLKPATVIELGSAYGSSAAWFADLMEQFAIDGSVYSVDIVKPPLEHKNVQFLQGDCNRIEETLTDELLKSLPHPFLVIEDAHVNVQGVLEHLDKYIEPGDYLLVEDSPSKIDAIRGFERNAPGRYLVDTYYTDFFGLNATCCVNSIFKALPEPG